MSTTNKPLANPLVVLREEFDDWTILFDPDTGHAYGINPVSAFIWQLLDGKHSVTDIVEEVRDHYSEVPPEAEAHIREFIDQLMSKGLAGRQYQV